MKKILFIILVIPINLMSMVRVEPCDFFMNNIYYNASAINYSDSLLSAGFNFSYTKYKNNINYPLNFIATGKFDKINLGIEYFNLFEYYNDFERKNKIIRFIFGDSFTSYIKYGLGISYILWNYNNITDKNLSFDIGISADFKSTSIFLSYKYGFMTDREIYPDKTSDRIFSGIKYIYKKVNIFLSLNYNFPEYYINHNTYNINAKVVPDELNYSFGYIWDVTYFRISQNILVINDDYSKIILLSNKLSSNLDYIFNDDLIEFYLMYKVQLNDKNYFSLSSGIKINILEE